MYTKQTNRKKVRESERARERERERERESAQKGKILRKQKCKRGKVRARRE